MMVFKKIYTMKSAIKQNLNIAIILLSALGAFAEVIILMFI